MELRSSRPGRPAIALAVLGLVTLASACGGGSDDSSAGGSGAGSGDDVVVEEVAAGGGGAEALAPVVAAIEATGYDCSPESFVMTSAVRETCLTTSSISLSAYAWGSADEMASQIDAEVACSADSGLGQLTSLRGDDWAVAAVPLGGGSSPEVQASIDASLAAVSATLGGTVVSTPCV